MKISKIHFFVFGLMFISGAFMFVNSTAAESQEEIRHAIEAVSSEWTKNISAGNAAGVAALYSEDAKLLPPNSDFVAGRDGITATWQGMIDAGAKGAKLSTLEVTGMGDQAAEVGTYEIMDAQGSVMDKGKYIVLWKKEGSAWKLHRDIWNSSMQAPGSGESE